MVLCAFASASCNSRQKQAQATNTDITTDNPKVKKAKEEIVGHIKELYAGTDRIGESNERFACHSWWETVAAVDKKDADLEEIGFFNDDLWTQMQDSNPDDFEVRDIKFQQLDVEKGTALVDFVLWSSIQTVHQKFELCREDGDWRIHNIIRYRTDSDGKEVELDMMKEMRNYLAEPGEEASELTFANMDGIYDSLDDQPKNMKTVLEAMHQLEKQGYMSAYPESGHNENTIAEIENAFKNVTNITGLMARWQIVRQHPTVVCDTGHNPGAWEYLGKQLENTKCRELRIVFGLVEDKDVYTVMSLLPKNATYYYTKGSTKRAFPETSLKIFGDQFGLKGDCYPTVEDAYQAAMQGATSEDFIFVGGSTYVVADFMKSRI